MSTCDGTWFNDTEFEPGETAHVHRCHYEAGHVDHHQCGFTYGTAYGVPLLCGIGF